MDTYTIKVFDGTEIVRVYSNVEDHNEEYNEELGENILYIIRGGKRENILICCSGWSYGVYK
jgi:hypothetical protein